MKRVMLLVGAGGMLASDVEEALGDRFDLIALREQDLDITDATAVKKVMRKHRPDVVVNAAAYTDVDGCERNPDLAFRVNALGARNLAVQAERFSAELFHISTDYVFDGEAAEAYDEFAATNPLGLYARSKLAGEELVRSLCRRHYVLRISVLFGPRGRSFVDAVLDRARRGEDLRVPAGRIGSPTYTWDVAEAIGRLAGSELYGLFHYNQGEAVDRAGFARAILKAADISGIKINEVDAGELPEVAPRPRNAAMAMRLWELEGLPAPRTLAEALAHHLARAAGDGVTQGKGPAGRGKDLSETRSHRRERQTAWVPQAEIERQEEEQPPARNSRYDRAQEPGPEEREGGDDGDRRPPRRGPPGDGKRVFPARGKGFGPRKGPRKGPGKGFSKGPRKGPGKGSGGGRKPAGGKGSFNSRGFKKGPGKPRGPKPDR